MNGQAILLVAWIIAALNTAFGLGSGKLDFWFWVNAVLMLAIPVVGFIAAREDAR